MKSHELLVLVRFDVEPFKLVGPALQPRIYDPSMDYIDHRPIFEAILDVLENHGARGAFAIGYAMLADSPHHLRPILDRLDKGHEVTWHLHLTWDPVYARDWKKSNRKFYIAGYRGKALEERLDHVEGLFKSATGFLPKINLNANFSSNTHLLRVLSDRGYTAAGDYSPNTDYSWLGLPADVGPKHVQRIGDGAPCFPYAPQTVYRPSRHDGMLAGDLPILEVAMPQFGPGVGFPHQDTYKDTDEEIHSIKNLIRGRTGLQTLVFSNHTFPMFQGDGEPDQRFEKNLGRLDQVLSFVDTIRSARYTNYAEAKKRYETWEREERGAPPYVQDAQNGALVWNDKHSLKLHAIGAGAVYTRRGAPASMALTMAQDNGLAEWSAEGLPVGPIIPRLLGNQIHRRGALMSTEVIRSRARQLVPQACLSYRVRKTQTGATLDTCVPVGGGELEEITTVNLAHGCEIVKTSRLSGARGRIIHLFKFHPRFDVVAHSGGAIHLADRKKRQSLTLSSPGPRRTVSRRGDCLAIESAFRQEAESRLSC